MNEDVFMYFLLKMEICQRHVSFQWCNGSYLRLFGSLGDRDIQ